jgi:hypothetical protein
MDARSIAATAANGGTSDVKPEAVAKNSGNAVTQTVTDEKRHDNASGDGSGVTNAS